MDLRQERGQIARAISARRSCRDRRGAAPRRLSPAILRPCRRKNSRRFRFRPRCAMATASRLVPGCPTRKRWFSMREFRIHVPARLVGRDGIVLDPRSAGIAVEVGAGIDRAVHRGKVQAGAVGQRDRAGVSRRARTDPTTPVRRMAEQSSRAQLQHSNNSMGGTPHCAPRGRLCFRATARSRIRAPADRFRSG